MLSCEGLDRVQDPSDDAVERVSHHRGLRLRPARSSIDVEALLRRLARHRSGRDDIDIAFGRHELQRFRLFLVFASQARGRVVETRRQKVRRTMDGSAANHYLVGTS